MDGSSHSGKTISLGQGAVHTESTKQRLKTKASTRGELVSLSDDSSGVIRTRDFLLHQGYQVGPAEILQHNISHYSSGKEGKACAYLGLNDVLVDESFRSSQPNFVRLKVQQELTLTFESLVLDLESALNRNTLGFRG